MRNVAAACIWAASAATAIAETALHPGAYQIKSSLLLPNLDTVDVSRTDIRCLTAETGAENHKFAVLSENNPLRGCPMVNVRESGPSLTFDIKCTGSNLAKANAEYQLMGDTFRGRINMTMGGKNMTMIEVQEGHRTGACSPPS